MYLAISAATSAEPVGIWRSPAIKEEEEEVPEDVTKVTDEVEVL